MTDLRANFTRSGKNNKVVALGDQSVGKTSLVTKSLFEQFDDKYQATIGLDFMSKTMYIGDQTVRLQIWDTAGQERFRALTPSYIRDADVVVMVYDITSKKSFDSIWEDKESWIEQVYRAVIDNKKNVILVIAGNKIDLEQKRQVTREDGEKKKKEMEEGEHKDKFHKVIFLETSAKAGANVKTLFKKIGQTLLDIEDQTARPVETEMIDININPTKPETNDGCSC